MNIMESEEQKVSLERKIQQAITLLRTTCRGRGVVELAYSGGKDSDVILELAKMAGIEFRAIYKNTTVGPPGTIAYVKSKGVEILRPTKSLKNILNINGHPDNRNRFCCGYLKEYKVLDTCIIGVRRAESSKRAKRYFEPTECRIFSAKEKSYQIMPILERHRRRSLYQRKRDTVPPLVLRQRGKFPRGAQNGLPRMSYTRI